jgi:hypothetical protein
MQELIIHVQKENQSLPKCRKVGPFLMYVSMYACMYYVCTYVCIYVRIMYVRSMYVVSLY